MIDCPLMTLPALCAARGTASSKPSTPEAISSSSCRPGSRRRQAPPKSRAGVAILVWSGYGVAMANGHPEGIAVADEVAPFNDEDGVAVVLERVYGTG